jgi:3-oxoacyl-[acyl-carrier protein] reductase
MSDSLLSLQGRVALITGSGHGIGAATARLFAQAGAHVALLDRDGAGVAETAKHVALAGGDALSFEEDITDGFATERIIDRIVEEWDRLDILVNNAGIHRRSTLQELTDEDWEAIIDVNLKGTMVCTRAAVPKMIERGSGRIISAAAGPVRIGYPGLTAWAASKGGVVAMTRTWARELGPKGITANAVAPGLIDTEGFVGDSPDETAAVVARTPARRLGTPEEVAAVYLFLASDLASFVNGAIVGVDGGLLL